MHRHGLRHAGLVTLSIALSSVLLTSCATFSGTTTAPTPGATPAAAPGATPPGPGAAAAAAAGRPPGAPAATPPQPPLRAFADVVRDAKESPGFFRTWRKDDKVWLEVAPEQLNKPFFMGVSLSRGLGERWLLGGLMGGPWSIGGENLVELRRVGNNLQLIARNTTFTARPGSPEALAVRDAFSDSLLGVAPVLSQPHPERKTVLIEANALLLRDIPRGQYVLERSYRNQFTFDAPNSSINEVRSSAERTTINITAHYQQARIPLPPPSNPAAPQQPPFFGPPTVTPDPRSLFLGYLYTLAKLPEQPMQPRLSDPRIGHYTTTQYDFSSEAAASPRRHLVNRWRLEKKDPAAALSEPVKPITFWLGREIPEQYRKAIADGVLEWNKAFEKIGFRNALVVKQQPADADFDTLDVNYPSIRWLTTAHPSFGAIGPAQIDLRTGEILDADIGWDANMTRAMRFLVAETGQGRATAGMHYEPMYDPASGQIRPEAFGMQFGSRSCIYMHAAAREYGFAFALLESRGELDPHGPEAEAFVHAFLKDVTMHEVGHSLGLWHNFRSSTTLSLKELADPEITRRKGLTGSVMEYRPPNIALRNEKPVQAFTETLGDYDYWAIEYAYKPIAPEAEKAELARIAARSNEPQLAFGDDLDNFYGLDPEVNIFDLSSDPLAYFRRRVLLSRELWENLQARQLKPGESYNVLRRRFLSGFGAMAQPLATAAKYIGGISMVHDHAGSPRPPMKPVAAARQREALALLNDGLFRSSSFRVSPTLMQRMAIDRNEVAAQFDPFTPGMPPVPVVAVPEMILAVQRDVLNRLMSPTVARQLEASRLQVAKPSEVLSLNELYGSLQGAIWEEARKGTNTDHLRRNLQRDHLRRVTAAITGPAQAMSADARSVLRAQARQLRDQLASAQKAGSLDAETRAHYAESYEALNEALRATMVRATG